MPFRWPPLAPAGVPDFESARSWALQTKGQMDELAYQAADLPVAIRRDVAFA